MPAGDISSHGWPVMNRVTRARHLTLVLDAVDVDDELERLIKAQAGRLATAPSRAERVGHKSS